MLPLESNQVIVLSLEFNQVSVLSLEFNHVINQVFRVFFRV